MRITGTFIDEITHDIPSQNWGVAEWRREFALYRRIGLDTVVVIRAGYRDQCLFPARSVPDLLPCPDDLARVFLDLAEEHGLGLYFGLYDSGRHWLRGAYWREVELNRAFVEEVAERYGSSPAFAGWYVCHETSRNALNIVELYRALGEACRAARPVPVLISPFPQGPKQFSGEEVFALEETVDHWDHIFAESAGAFDICAFQDGQIPYRDLPAFGRAIRGLCDRYGVRCWANVETFDRDKPLKFPPLDWRHLRFKLEAAAGYADKAITFEFAHFMSPHSTWPSARQLFRRYAEHEGIPVDAIEGDGF